MRSNDSKRSGLLVAEGHRRFHPGGPDGRIEAAQGSHHGGEEESEDNGLDESIRVVIKCMYDLLNDLKPLLNTETLWKPHALLLIGDYFILVQLGIIL